MTTLKKKRAHSITEIANAIQECKGFLTDAAKMLGITYHGVWKRVSKNPRLQAIVEEVRESSLDHVENKLWERIEAGELTAIIFYLKCKGKSRGYIERTYQELEARHTLQKELTSPESQAEATARINAILEDIAGPKNAEKENGYEDVVIDILPEQTHSKNGTEGMPTRIIPLPL